MSQQIRIFNASTVLWSMAILAIVFDTGFYLLALKPREREIARIEAEYKVQREKKRPVKDERGNTDRGLTSLYEKIPAWQDFTKIMGEIYDKADSLNLLIHSASYRSEAIKDSKLMKVTISMPVKGSYGEIKRFIYDLETSNRLFIIQGLTLGSGGAEEGDVSLSLTIAVHFKG